MLKSKTAIIFTLLTLVCISVMLYVSETNNNELSKKNIDNQQRGSVNFLVTKMKLVINDTDGSVKAKINTDKVKHDASNNQTNLNYPQLILQQSDGTLIITANNGKIIHNKIKIKQMEQIILSDNVKIEKVNSQNRNLPFIRLETNTITYLPQQDLVTTNDKVIIKTEYSTTTANGLLFNKNTKKIQLLKNVESTYSSNITQNNWKRSKLNKNNADNTSHDSEKIS